MQPACPGCREYNVVLRLHANAQGQASSISVIIGALLTAAQSPWDYGSVIGKENARFCTASLPVPSTVVHAVASSRNASLLLEESGLGVGRIGRVDSRRGPISVGSVRNAVGFYPVRVSVYFSISHGTATACSDNFRVKDSE